MTSRLVRAFALFAAIGVLAFGVTSQNTEPTRAGALGGPVILGGDDLTDHGAVDGGGNVVLGWLYIKNSLASVSANASRGNGSIAALGSAASPETNSSDAGAAVGAAAQELGLTVNYYNGDTAMNQFFADLAASTANPSIIWIAGDQASNDLGDGPGDEVAPLTTNASAIASFVASGGGLMSHGTVYTWLQALLPGATTVDGGCDNCDDLYFTPEGSTAFPTLTLSDINAGPWHNHFEGNFGGLQVLVRSTEVNDATGTDAAVILGGAQVTFEEQPPSAQPSPESDCLVGVPGLPCGGQAGGGNPGDAKPNQADAAPPPAPVPEQPAPVQPAPVTSPVSEAAGVAISAPDTGTGPSGGTDWTWMLLAAAAVGAIGAAATIAGSKLRG